MSSASRGRRAYDRVVATDEPSVSEHDLESQPSPLGNDTSLAAASSKSSTPVLKKERDDDDGERITVVVLDPAHNKFNIEVNPSWTVARLKKQGVSVHMISSSQQRLIFMGRLLSDDMVLKHAKINTDGAIIHLFPKPRVVLQGSSSERNPEETASDASPRDGLGAHVPQIVLDPDEAQMRSQILVLGSAEIMDAQNNVKLLSFFLLIITSMELLALFTIMVGVPPSVADETNIDDTVPTDDMHHNMNEAETRTWRNSDYFDLVLNLFGFYAAMLGIKATTENTRRLALQYLVCTVVCGVLWNVFYYYLNVQTEKEVDVEEHKDKDNANEPWHTTQDYLAGAFFAILIPMMIWGMCCFRAYQFYHLLEEAEREAEERIQNEIQMVEEGNRADDEEDDATGVLT